MPELIFSQSGGPEGNQKAQNTEKMMQGVGGPSCTPEWLSQELDSHVGGPGDAPLLILDCRGPNDFNMSHIVGAVHVAIPTLMFRRLKNGTLPVASVIKYHEGKDSLDTILKTGTLVLYDQDTSVVTAACTTVIGLLAKKLREEGCKVRILEGKCLKLFFRQVWIL